MSLQKSELEQIKSKLRAYSERYKRKIESSRGTLAGMTKNWEETVIISAISTRANDKDCFESLFAEELKEKGENEL